MKIMNQNKIITLLFLLVAVTILSFANFLAAPSTANAQGPDYDRINNVAEALNCPTCSGINLADCRTQTCTQWKDQIKDLLDKGYNEQEVLDYFVTQYGPQVLQEPPKSGFTLTLWILPVVAIFIGGILLFFTMRKWTQNQPVPVAVTTQKSPSPSISPDDYLSQVDKDLGLE